MYHSMRSFDYVQVIYLESHKTLTGEDTLTEFQKVAQVSELSPGQSKLVIVEEERILLSNVDGNYFAIGEVCPHAGGSLSEGTIEGIEVECPLHGSRFNLKTGGATEPPAYERVNRYSVRLEDGYVLIGAAEDYS